MRLEPQRTALVLMLTVWAPSALAAPQALTPLPAAASPSSTTGNVAAPATRPRAWLRLDVGQKTPWVGQAVPVTVTAFFRDVEGVTLEGTLQLASKGVVTSSFAREPRQASQVVDGAQTFVVKWTGTFTPSSEGPLELSVDLPVRLRYRDAPPPPVAVDPQDDDPFADFGGDPFDSSAFDRMRQRMQQMFEQPQGRVHEQEVALKASSPSIDVRALPAAGQPATFGGAVGKFDVRASVSTDHPSVSEPLTLRVTVEGDGDLDRVDLAGVAPSGTWKTYPPKATLEAASGRQRERKVFEQVLIPLRGGDVVVPPVSFVAFDPALGKYVTEATSPVHLSVDGVAAAPVPAPSAAPASPAPPPPDAALSAPRASLPRVSPWSVALSVLPVLLLVAAATLVRALRRRRGERALRRSMKRAAAEGSAGRFFDAAHRLIETRLADRWGVSPEDVTATVIHERLGPKGDTLIEVLSASQAMRFGRAGADGAQLQALCASVEQSLRGAS